jgi:hypothetical protein
MKRMAFLLIGLLALFHTDSSYAQDKKSSIGINEVLMPEINVVNNKLYVKNASAGKKVEIITIIGNKVQEIKVTSIEFEYELSLPRAIYIFKLDGVVKKFVIK